LSESNSNSRANRHLKKQKQKKRIVFLIGLGALFCVFLITWITVGNNESKEEPQKSEAELATGQQEEDNHSNEDTSVNNETSQLEDEENSDDQKPDSDIREVESDENDVEKAYEGEWEPVETEQSGEHVTNYDDGSDDRKEIKQAVTEATGIDSDNIIEHWIGNNGEQKVEATVSDTGNKTSYRVYLSWINEEGWQVDRVDKLKEYEG